MAICDAPSTSSSPSPSATEEVSSSNVGEDTTSPSSALDALIRYSDLEAALDKSFRQLSSLRALLFEARRPDSTCIDDSECSFTLLKSLRSTTRQLTAANELLEPLPRLHELVSDRITAGAALADYLAQHQQAFDAFGALGRQLWIVRLPTGTTLVDQLHGTACAHLTVRKGATAPSWLTGGREACEQHASVPGQVLAPLMARSEERAFSTAARAIREGAADVGILGEFIITSLTRGKDHVTKTSQLAREAMLNVTFLDYFDAFMSLKRTFDMATVCAHKAHSLRQAGTSVLTQVMEIVYTITTAFAPGAPLATDSSVSHSITAVASATTAATTAVTNTISDVARGIVSTPAYKETKKYIEYLRKLYNAMVAARTEPPVCDEVVWKPLELLTKVADAWGVVSTTFQDVLAEIRKPSLQLLGMPNTVLAAAANVMCFVRNGLGSVRSWAQFVQDKIYAFYDMLSLGTWGASRPPACNLPKCLECVRRI